MMLMAPLAITLLMGLSGCVVSAYPDRGPDWDGEWDGTVFVGGGYDRDYHGGAFRSDGHHSAGEGSARGHESMGGRGGGGGGGHGSSGGGHK